MCYLEIGKVPEKLTLVAGQTYLKYSPVGENPGDDNNLVGFRSESASAVDGIQVFVEPQVWDDVDLCRLQGFVQKVMYFVFEFIFRWMWILQASPRFIQEQAAQKKTSY